MVQGVKNIENDEVAKNIDSKPAIVIFTRDKLEGMVLPTLEQVSKEEIWRFLDLKSLDITTYSQFFKSLFENLIRIISKNFNLLIFESSSNALMMLPSEKPYTIAIRDPKAFAQLLLDIIIFTLDRRHLLQ